MTIPEELRKLEALLAAMKINAEQFACVADDLTPGQLRGAMLMYAELLDSARGYLGAVIKLHEAHHADQG